MLGVEEVGYQQALKQEIDRVSAERRFYLPTRAIHQDKDKVRRAIAISVFFEKGWILLKDLNDNLYNELVTFPMGIHDDIVDALMGAIELTRGSGFSFATI